MFKRIHVIINPASGQDKPMLAVLNSAFKDRGIEWDVFITKQAGDGYRLAKESLEAGADAIGVYGGDGTITEVAGALVDTNVPLVIFPGGTANAIALSLGIPTDLTEASALTEDDKHEIRTFDIGKVGDRYFLVALGIGLAGALIEDADREAKDKLGPLAYAKAAIQALSRTKPACYHITIDGEQVEREGVTCVVANSGNFGIPGLTLAQTIDMNDGLLDVIVIPNTNLDSLVSMAASMVRKDDASSPLEHWQGREIMVRTEPPQSVQVDGEILEPGEWHVRVLPHALKVLVPRPASS